MFFSDIASFTTIVESMPPQKSFLLLSRYFQEMSKIVDQHGGIVVEFIGDAIMCIYGAPVVNEKHPTVAVMAAVEMLSAMTGINQWLERRGLPKPLGRSTRSLGVLTVISHVKWTEMATAPVVLDHISPSVRLGSPSAAGSTPERSWWATWACRTGSSTALPPEKKAILALS